jgi:hypothetical protein
MDRLVAVGGVGLWTFKIEGNGVCCWSARLIAADLRDRACGKLPKVKIVSEKVSAPDHPR